MAVNVAVIYYSATGTVHALAEALAEGAGAAGAEVRLRRVPGPLQTAQLGPGQQDVRQDAAGRVGVAEGGVLVGALDPGGGGPTGGHVPYAEEAGGRKEHGEKRQD